MKQWVKVAIGLGSNLGDKAKNIEAAIQRLTEEFLSESQVSSLYESEPWGITDQPKFINAVMVGLSEWKPPAILNYLKSLERELGRTTGVKNGPRVIDLDLLVYGNETWESEGVTVPHPGLAQRSFVLVPLADLWPDWRHPKLNQTTVELIARLPSVADLRKMN